MKKIIVLIIYTVIISGLKAANTDDLKDTIQTDSKKVTLVYGTQDYEKFVGNAEVVKGDILRSYPTLIAREALKGQLPGLFVFQNNGNIGTENITSFVRGNTKGYVTIVDGVERQLLPYDLDQIEEITLLKDPVSKAMYGGRITNGILIVKTKRGKTMKSEFHASVQRGIKTPTVMPSYLNAHQYASYYNQALANDNNGVKPVGKGYTEEQLDGYLNGKMPLKYPDVNYHDQFLNSSMDITRINTEYYGGTDKTKYYFHTGYQNEGGFEAYGDNKTRFQSVNIQGNLDAQFSKDISLHTNLTSVIGHRTRPASFSYSTLSTRLPNAYPILVAPDSAGGTNTWKDNPWAGMVQSGYEREHQYRLQADLGFVFKLGSILDGLSYKPEISFDFYHKQNIRKVNTIGIYSIKSFDSIGNPVEFNELQKEKLATTQSLGDDDYSRRWGVTNTLTYQKKFGKHDIDANLVYFISQLFDAQVFFDYKRQNLAARVNYTYDSRYVIEGVMNYTGSQSYAASNRFKTFPALGASWIVSNESFMKRIDAIDYLKLNMSWGVMGDGDISPYLWRETWSMLADQYTFNSSAVIKTANILNVQNLLLDWPKQRQIDLSLEGRLFKILNFKASYFDYLSYDELSQRSNLVLSVLGGDTFLPYSNYGKTGLRGFEGSLSITGKKDEFSYGIRLHSTYAKSKRILIDELPDPNYSNIGTSTSAIRGYVAIGKYTQEDLNKVNSGDMAQPGYMSPKDLKVGSIKYQDVNNDKILDKYDLEVIGNSIPELMYGGNINLGYKNIQFLATLVGYGNFHRLLNNNNYFALKENLKYSQVVIDGLPNGNEHPLLSTGANQNDFQPSTWWLVDAGFLKLQNLAVSYSMPKNIVESLKLSDLKISLYGNDLMRFSKFKTNDPESIDAGVNVYPLFRTIALGLEISL